MCHDVIRLKVGVEKSCDCGATGGRYLNNLYAEYWGENAVPLGFANGSFVRALSCRPENGWGHPFTAFVIPKECDTMKYYKVRPE